MTIPISLINDLKHIPRDRRVALLMRHSARFPITHPDETYLVGLTEEGVRMAEELGALLGEIYPGGRLFSSPVERCIDTAQAITRGAGWAGEVQPDVLLSHHHIEPAWDQFNRGEVNGILPVQLCDALDLVLGRQSHTPALDILVTHDTIVGTFAGCLMQAPVLNDFWPAFLEGLFFWRVEDLIHVRWRGLERVYSADYKHIK
jgi:broad specificity phosphatase PhoE